LVGTKASLIIGGLFKVTKQQREFRKQMKELEREGLVDKQPRRTRSMRRTTGYGILGTIFIIWQLWAAMTWFMPGTAARIAMGIRFVFNTIKLFILNLFF